MARSAIKRWSGVIIGLALSLGGIAEGWKPQPVQAADRIRVVLGPIDLPISLESLEAFAKDGTTDTNLALIARRIKPERLALVQKLLQFRLPIDVVTVDRYVQIELVQAGFKRLGLVIQPRFDVNGDTAMRAALVLAAASPEGLTPLNVIRQFPTAEIRVDVNRLLRVLEAAQDVPRVQAAIVQAISQQAATEAAANPRPDTTLPDLGQPGPFRFTKQTVMLTGKGPRQTPQGLVDSYTFPVDLYVPEGLTQPAPLVVMVHGFGSDRATYDYALKHLASHGFVVAAPEHVGSNLAYRQAYLAGAPLDVDVSPLELISRAREVSATIDEVERLVKTDATWRNLVNLEQIGILGNSYGGTSALVSAGATLSDARLQRECAPHKHPINFSVLLQCRTGDLTPEQMATPLVDRRIKAVFALYPLTSAVLGPEGMGTITIPTFLMAGSRDVFTPVAEEQVHPFVWLKTPTKYFGLMIKGTHFSTATDEINAMLPGILRSPAPNLGRKYMYAFTVAFFYAHLAQRSEYFRYLTAAYAKAYGREPLDLRLIRSLTPAQLEAAYGGRPPQPIIPPIGSQPSR